VRSRINRAIELLAQDQAIYYVGAHTGCRYAQRGVRAIAGHSEEAARLGRARQQRAMPV